MTVRAAGPPWGVLVIDAHEISKLGASSRRRLYDDPYYRGGRRFEESARTEKRNDAVRLLKVRATSREDAVNG